MITVTIYTTTQCPYCIHAKKLLTENAIHYTEVNIETQPEKREEMLRLCSGKRTVPQILFSIGGFDDLKALHAAGTLKQLFESR